jgi:hypothetical protein
MQAEDVMALLPPWSPQNAPVGGVFQAQCVDEPDAPHPMKPVRG